MISGKAILNTSPHPPSPFRASRIIAEMERRNLPVNRRLVTTYLRVQAKPVDNSPASAVFISGVEIIRLADSGGEKASDRGERVARELQNALMAGGKIADVKLDKSGRTVTMMGVPVITPTADDAELAGTSVSQVSQSAAVNIRKALMKERYEQGY